MPVPLGWGKTAARPKGGRFAFFCIPALALFACAAPTPRPRAAAPAQLDVASRAVTVLPAPSGVLSFPEPPPKPIPARPVTGLAMEQLTAELGSPDFRRSEPPGEVWQYRGADCVLDVFLLRQNGGYRVISSAVRDRHGSAPPDHCAEAPVQGRQSLARPAAARENDRAAHLFPD